jgi:hypothetical protein
MGESEQRISSSITIGGLAMKYPDGTEARLGDRVRITNGDTGVIVASMDTNEYGNGYSAQDYAHLKTGILILTDKGALVRLEEPDHSDLLERER